MKTNPLSEVVKDRACANCGSGSIQNQVFRFIGSDNRRINLCNKCVIELRRRAETRRLCAFCGSLAKYATWQLKTTKALGTMTFDDGNNIPEFWLLCEKHFTYLFKASMMSVKQKQLTDY